MREMLTHSLPKIPNLHSGPINDTVSKVCAAASGGLNSGICVIMTATLLMETSNSIALTTPRQPASRFVRPSGRNKDSWNRSPLTTGPRTPSNSSPSNLLVSSWRNCSISEEWSLLGSSAGLENSGEVSAESERSGSRSSGAPIGRLSV